MSYTKTTWINGAVPAINATNLNKIEDGIADAFQEIIDSKAVTFSEFLASGTWTKPAAARWVLVDIISGGAGGGGGGRYSTATAARGGRGGAGGGRLQWLFPAGDLGATVSVVVGAGGDGGLGVAVGASDAQFGAVGQDGGNSSFGDIVVKGGQYPTGSAFVGKGGGLANAPSNTPGYGILGPGGQNTDVAGLSAEWGGGNGDLMYGSLAKGAGSSLFGGSAGGAGGYAVTPLNTLRYGALGGEPSKYGVGSGVTSEFAGANGADGDGITSGRGGGGGGGASGANGYDGGTGGFPAGGGGGGGGSNSSLSYRGGNGASGGNGVVRVYAW